MAASEGIVTSSKVCAVIAACCDPILGIKVGEQRWKKRIVGVFYNPTTEEITIEGSMTSSGLSLVPRDMSCAERHMDITWNRAGHLMAFGNGISSAKVRADALSIWVTSVGESLEKKSKRS